MKSRKLLKLLTAPLLLAGLFGFFVFFMLQNKDFSSSNNIINKIVPTTSRPTLPPPPASFIIPQKLHVYETFNNCGPASLSMLLSYFDVNKTQKELGDQLRPHQQPPGDNDDKSVTLEELAHEGENLGFTTYHRPNGDQTLLKQFISNGIPVITRTWLKENEDIGHYRLIRGYNESELIQDDSLQGKNLTYTYEDFDILWKKFNYEYLVLVPKDKEDLAERILGENLDEKKSWKIAVRNAKNVLAQNPEDIYARFNLSVAYYNSGDYRQAALEFEKVEKQLPFRTLWYQIEPIQTYVALKNYERVFEITDKVLNNGNRGFSELYLIRGKIYQEQRKTDLARIEFEKAVLYNKNLQEAQHALYSL